MQHVAFSNRVSAIANRIASQAPVRPPGNSSESLLSRLAAQEGSSPDRPRTGVAKAQSPATSGIQQTRCSSRNKMEVMTRQSVHEKLTGLDGREYIGTGFKFAPDSPCLALEEHCTRTAKSDNRSSGGDRYGKVDGITLKSPSEEDFAEVQNSDKIKAGLQFDPCVDVDGRPIQVMKSSEAHELARTHSGDRDKHPDRRPSLTPSLPFDAMMHAELFDSITDYARQELGKASTCRPAASQPEHGQALQHEGANRKPSAAVLGSQDGTAMLDLVRKTDVSQLALVETNSNPASPNRVHGNGSNPQSIGKQHQSNGGQGNESRAISVKRSSKQQQSNPSTDEPSDLWPPVFIEKVPFQQAASPEFALCS